MNPTTVKKILSRKFKNVEEAKSYLRDLISKCEDMTKKTDIRIILTKLEAKTVDSYGLFLRLWRGIYCP
ncbi:MAG: hypothetical protein ACTSYT_05090 [Candidatus Asgardarchaeia archaeon]